MQLILILILTLLLAQGTDSTFDTNHQFFYADQGVYYLMNAEPVVLPAVPQGVYVSWTPDGGYLTYFQDNVYTLMDADTGTVVYTFESDVTTALWKPIWSEDGRHFVVESIEFINEQDYITGLVLFTVDESYQVIDSQRIDEDAFRDPVWSPDGTRLLFVDAFTPTDTPVGIHIYDVENMTLTTRLIDAVLTTPVYWWDDRHIAVLKADGIYQINLETDVAQLLFQTDTSLPSTNAWGFSPDHTRLMFNQELYANTESGFERISRVDAPLSWSADSQYFLATVAHHGSACYPNKIRNVCYATVSLDIVVNNRNGQQVAEIAKDVSVVDFGWRP